ncbi:unnamed protein product [Miscanthus lutarioriparius]|uniref:DUF1618 domain-containing protein n=1 Tax=Miscanthus lutarioriparius TaxID=422564 RepID=A0A811R955_9POAL|nr:unnamed protein product [Miscanthus lutarioriparius]
MKPPPSEQASGSASASSASKRRLFLEPPPPVNSSTLAPFPTAGSKRSSESPGKDLGICLSVSSASATPASSPSQGGSAAGGGSGSGSGGAGGSGAAVASDIRAAGASDIGAAVASDIGATGASDRGLVAAGTSTANAIIVEGDEPVQEGDVPCGKRHESSPDAAPSPAPRRRLRARARAHLSPVSGPPTTAPTPPPVMPQLHFSSSSSVAPHRGTAASAPAPTAALNPSSRDAPPYTAQPAFSSSRSVETRQPSLPPAPDIAVLRPPPPWTLPGSSSTDSSTATTCQLAPVDPESVPDGIELCNWATAVSATHASAYTSRGLKVNFLFPIEGACWLSTHAMRRCLIHVPHVPSKFCASTAINSPRDFFVFSSPYMGEDVSVHRIPKFLPKSSAVSQLFGLLRDQSDCDKYVVANLEMLNPKKGYVEVLLHRWWPSSESWSSRFLEKVTLPSIIDMRKWQTDQVIAYHKDLVWADLKQGILFCFKNPLEKDTELRIIYLPRIPHMKSVRRPETFMSVGCCNGKLKFVHLDINLWANMPLNLEVSEYHMPCFPVLHTDKDNILYLTISKKDKDNKRAWLLQVDMKARKDSKGASPHQVDTESDTSTEFDTQFSTDSDTSTESSMEYWALVGVIDYLGFCRHQKPPLILLQD